MRGDATPPGIGAGAIVAGRPAPQPAAQLVEISARVLEDLHDDWEDLSQNASEPNPFLDQVFVAAAIDLFPAAEKPRILVVRTGPVLAGLMIVKEDFGFNRLPIRFASTHRHLHQFLETPLVRKGSEDAFADGLCGWLDKAPNGVQFLFLSRQRARGPVMSALTTACRKHKRLFREVETYDRPMVIRADRRADSRTGGPDDHSAKAVSAQSFKKLRAKRNRLSKHGPIAYDELGAGGALDEWLDEFIAIEHRSWKGANGTSLASSSEEMRFFKTLVSALFDRGRIRAARLMVGDKTIACFVDIAAGRSLFAFKAAYDPEFKKYSPGVLLDYYGLESFLNNPAYDSIDSCADGDHSVLSRMWRDRVSICSVVIGRRNVFSRLFLSAALSVQTAGEFLKRMQKF